MKAAKPASLGLVASKAPVGKPAPSPPVSHVQIPRLASERTVAPKGALASLKARYRASKPQADPYKGHAPGKARPLSAFSPQEKQTYHDYLNARAAGNQPKFTHDQMQQMGLLPNIGPDYHFDEHGRRILRNSFATKVTQELFDTALGAPAVPIIAGASLAQDANALAHGKPGEATHTYRNVLKPIGVSTKEAAVHPLRNPVNTALTGFGIASAGAGLLAKGAAAGSAMAEEAGAGAKLAAGARTFAKPAASHPIELKVKGADGNVTAIRVPRSKNQLRNLVKRARVARSNQQLAKEMGEPSTTFAGGVRQSFGTPQHKVGRAIRRNNELLTQGLEAPAHGLDKFHRKLGLLSPLNRSTLSDAEQMAADIASVHGRQIVGDPAAVHAAVMQRRLYHANAAALAHKELAHIATVKDSLKAAIDSGDEAAAKKASRALKRAKNEHGNPADHEAKIGLADLSAPHLLNPKPRLAKALAQMPRAIDIREGMGEQLHVKPGKDGVARTRLDEERQLHRLGARHAEIVHGAKGLETPLQELGRHAADQADLDRLRKTKTGAKVEQLQKLIERVQTVREKRGGPAHAQELAALKAELDHFAGKYGAHVKVLGAKTVNDALQAAAPAERRFIAEPVKPQEEAVAHHTVESAEALHAHMAETYEQVLGKFILGKHYKPGRPLREQYGLSGAERVEQGFRNKSNGIYKKALDGPTRGGSQALRRGYLKTVKDEKLAKHESDFHDFLNEHKNDEGIRKILDHYERMNDLQTGISDVREHAAFGGEVTPELLREKLGDRRLPTERAATPGVSIEETRPRPDLSIGKVRKAEAGSARAGAKLEQFRALDQQEQTLKGELEKLTASKPGQREKPAAKMLRLLADEEPRGARVAEIHHDLIVSGKLLRDQGAFYLPSRDLSDVKRVSAPAHTPSEFGLSPGNQTVGSDHDYTGALERQGRNRTDSTRLAQEAYREMLKLHSVDRGFKTLWSMSHETINEAGGIDHAVPIRASSEIPLPLRRQMNRVGFKGLTKEEEEQLPPRQVEKLRDYLFPPLAEVDRASNLTKDGVPVRWVDSRIADAYVRRQPRGVKVGKFRGKEFTGGDLVDAVNQPLRAGLLYSKPAYALNLLQGLGTNALTQGVFLPANIHRAFTLGKDLGWEDQHHIFSLVGEGSAHALTADGKTSWLGEATKNAGDFWNAVVDRLPRVTQFIHEARRMGYKTPEQMHALLHDEAHQADLIELTDIANREAIDYSMSPPEREYLRRAFFFYPWLRGATLWSLRYPLEHPIATAALAPIAQKGHADTVKALGETPSYADGMTHELGHTWNLANLNNFQTGVDVVKGISGLGEASSPDAAKAAGELGPVAGAAYTLLSGKTSLGHDLPQNTSRLKGALQSLYGGLPPVVLYNRATQGPDPHSNPSKQRTSSDHGLLNALEKWTAGALVPIHPNVAALNSKAETERVTQMGSRDAAIYHYGLEYEQIDKNFDKVVAVPTPELKQKLLTAVDTQREIDTHIRDYAKAKGVSTAELSGEQQLTVILGVLDHRGILTPAESQAAIAAVGQAAPQYRDALAKHLAAEAKHGAGGGGVLAEWKAALKAHHLSPKGPK